MCQQRVLSAANYKPEFYIETIQIEQLLKFYNKANKFLFYFKNIPKFQLNASKRFKFYQKIPTFVIFSNFYFKFSTH